MFLRALTPAIALALVATVSSAYAQHANEKRVTIDYLDLSGTQDLSSAPWVSHAAGFHLFEVGKPATLLIQELAENGNPEFVLGTAVVDTDHKVFGDAAVGLPNLPGKGRRVTLMVDAAHPLVSGAWMLGHTQAGFAGIDSVDAFHATKPITIEVYPLDARTRVNTETKADTAAFGGLHREPTPGLPIARHEGIRGDADIPASFKFDPSKPVGRVTITPQRPNS